MDQRVVVVVAAIREWDGQSHVTRSVRSSKEIKLDSCQRLLLELVISKNSWRKYKCAGSDGCVTTINKPMGSGGSREVPSTETMFLSGSRKEKVSVGDLGPYLGPQVGVW